MHLVTEWISEQLGNIIDFRKKRMLLVFSMATGHVFVSTESTIGYIIEACTIGLIVEVSSFWLVYG